MDKLKQAQAFIAGYKTYFVGATILLIGILRANKIEIPDYVILAAEAAGLIFVRAAIAKLDAKSDREPVGP